MPCWPRSSGVIKRNVIGDFSINLNDRFYCKWIFLGEYPENAISVIMVVRGWCVSVIEFHRLGIAVECGNLSMKWHVFAVQIKTMVAFSL